MKRRIIILGLTLLVALSLLSGCSKGEEKDLDTSQVVEENQEAIELQKESEIEEEDEYGIISEENSVKITDGRGEEVNISKNPERVVILFASFLDIWMNNGGKNIVGIVEPSEEYITPEIENFKTVGKRESISLEEVIALEPDLVILSSNTSSHIDMISPLEGAGAEVLALDYVYKEDYFKIAKLFATINDELNIYEAEAEKVKYGIEEIIGKVPEEDNPSAVIIRSTKSNTTVLTANTTLGEMFKDLKVINIADKENKQEGSMDFSLEKILEEDPDFIFLQIMGSDVDAVKEKLKSDVESNPAWSSLSAVKNDNYIVLPKELYTYKANNRYEEAYENLAEILYPEIFN